MPASSLDAVFYINEAPAIRYEDGLYHIGYDVGRIHAEFVMLPKVYANAMLLAEEAYAKGRYGSMDSGNVRKLKSK